MIFLNSMLIILFSISKAREFRANPLPSPTADNLPVKQIKRVTRPQPFNLDTECRMNRSEERKRQV
jgi:hypothetical protein